MSEEKDPSIFQIALSLFAAFFGVQNQANMARDEKYIEKNGIKVYFMMGFFLVFCFIISLIGIIKVILHFAM